MVHPRHFISEYVDPAIVLYRTNRTVKHLAVHAMTQVDVLAAVVAVWTAKQPTLDRGQERKFREQLGAREPVLALIQDAHDCHKHGGLTRTAAVAASQGQRPEQKTEFGFFLGHSFVEGPLTPYDVLVFKLNDGTQREVYSILYEAMQAWERELSRRGI
jgi:hypothetical protein